MPKNAGKKPAKYVIVRNHLLDLVRNGLANGSPVPSERELCEQFEVSRMTVRQAIDTLVVDGVLERHQGKGTFVAPPKLDLQVRLTSFTQEMRRRGRGTRPRREWTAPSHTGWWARSACRRPPSQCGRTCRAHT